MWTKAQSFVDTSFETILYNVVEPGFGILLWQAFRSVNRHGDPLHHVCIRQWLSFSVEILPFLWLIDAFISEIIVQLFIILRPGWQDDDNYDDVNRNSHQKLTWNCAIWQVSVDSRRLMSLRVRTANFKEQKFRIWPQKDDFCFVKRDSLVELFHFFYISWTCRHHRRSNCGALPRGTVYASMYSRKCRLQSHRR